MMGQIIWSKDFFSVVGECGGRLDATKKGDKYFIDADGVTLSAGDARNLMEWLADRAGEMKKAKVKK